MSAKKVGVFSNGSFGVYAAQTHDPAPLVTVWACGGMAPPRNGVVQDRCMHGSRDEARTCPRRA